MSDSPLRDAPHTLCVYEATLLEVVQNEVWHCSAGINRGPPGKSITLMVAYVSPKLHHPPLHQWYLHTYEVIHAVDTDAPPYYHRCWLLHLSLITAWMLFLIFVEVDVGFSQKQAERGLI